MKLSDKWNEVVEQYLPNASEDQIRVAKLIYFAGANDVCGLMNELCRPGNEVRLFTELPDILFEITHFAQEIKRK
jgi:hypothetical protein